MCTYVNVFIDGKKKTGKKRKRDTICLHVLLTPVAFENDEFSYGRAFSRNIVIRITTPFLTRLFFVFSNIVRGNNIANRLTPRDVNEKTICINRNREYDSTVAQEEPPPRFVLRGSPGKMSGRRYRYRYRISGQVVSLLWRTRRERQSISHAAVGTPNRAIRRHV